MEIVVYDLKNTLDEYRVYQQIEIDWFAEIFYSAKEQFDGDLGRLQGTLQPALDRFEALEEEKQDLFKSTLARFNRIYAFITQICRLFDKNIHKFSVYAKFLYTMLPKGGRDKVYVDDKVLLEYYRLKKTSRVESSWRAPRRASGPSLARLAGGKRSATL